MLFILDNMLGAENTTLTYANGTNITGTAGGVIPQDNIRSINVAIVTNTIIGSACLLGFFVFRTFMKQYQLRLYVLSITIRPPVINSTGCMAKYFGWLRPVMTTSDTFMLRASGLDALVLQKSCALGIQMFLPMAVIGCCLLVPLQIHEGFIRGDASYGKLTMSNIQMASPVMWAHWVVCFLFLGWIFLLLEFHTRQYAAVRQHYLRGGDDANAWRDLHMAEADGTLVHRGPKLLDVLGAANAAELLELEEELLEAEVRKRRWWHKIMISLTSWTGGEGAASASRHATSPSGRHPIDLAHDLMQGDFARDAAAAAAASSGDGGGGAAAGPAVAGVAGGSSSGSGKGVGGRLRQRGTTGDDVVLTVPDSQVMSAGGAGAGTAGSSSLDRLRSLDVENGGGGGGGGGSEAEAVARTMEGEDFGSQVAHKWWVSVTHVATKGGRSRKLTEEEAGHADVAKIMLAKPSVRYRKTVNAYDATGKRVAVNAQQYAVLVTNVNQPCYPEFVASKKHIGAGKCGSLAPDALPPRVKYELSGLLHGHAEAALKEAAGGKGTARDLAAAAAAGTTTPAAATSSSAVAVAGGAGGGSSRSGAELWAVAREHCKSGRLKALGRSREYSLVAHIFSTLFPEDYDRVVPVFNYRRVDLLMRVWDVRQAQLERARFRLNQTGQRPLRNTKCCRGPKVDAIDWLEADIARLEPLIMAERQAALQFGMTPSWFVLFRSQKAAAIASSCNILPMNQDLFQVHPAPGPEEVNWESLWFNNSQRVMRGWITTPFAVIVVLLPVSLLTSAISQLNSTFCQAVSWDWYCNSQGAVAKVAKGLVTGFLPSLLIVLWQGLALPRLVYLVAQSEGRHYSLFSVDRRMGEIYFYWDVFNMFAQGVLGAAAVAGVGAGAAVFQQSANLLNKPEQVPSIIGQALPASSKFFFTYLIMRVLMTVPLRFLITQPGVWQSWLRLLDLFPPCAGPQPPRTQFMRHAIRSPRYGVEFGNMLLIMLICCAFCIISPLMLLFGAAFFAGMWVFWRYQLIYNYQRKYEAGGLIWHFYVNRILVCTTVMVAFTGCVMIVKLAFVQATTLWVAGFIFIAAFAHRLNHRYMNAIVEMPLYLANAAPATRVPSTAYVPPPLQANGMGWYPEFNKVWEWFGMPGYSY